MGRKSASGGVTEHHGKIRLDIWYRGKRLRPVLDLAWSERNRRTALRIVAAIREKIRHGLFDPAEYFPEYGGLKALSVPASTLCTFRDYTRAWLASLGQKAPATRDDYRKALDRVWLDALGERPIKAIRYSELMTLMGELGVAGKTLNNYLISLRGVFEFAKRDGAIAHNPAAEIENAPVQRPAPDPFALPEVEAILGNLIEREDVQLVNYFAAAFFAGFRPSEQIALRWSDVDFKQRTVRVQRAVVRGQAKDSTKTYLVRDVELSDRAWAAIEAQRAHTQLAGREIFWNPATDEPWADIQSQWRIWKRCLKRLGLRYREPYQTRHTFATLALMAGANPAYIARQLGHTNANMLFRVYSKWIDGADRSREREKLNLGFGHDLATELIAEAKKFAQSNTYLAEREGFEPVSDYWLRSVARGAFAPVNPLNPPDLCTDLCTAKVAIVRRSYSDQSLSSLSWPHLGLCITTVSLEGTFAPLDFAIPKAIFSSRSNRSPARM